MASIEDLKSQISSRGGLARPNQFMVELPSGDSRAVNVLCTRVNLPGKQIITHDRRINMEFEKIAYGYAVDDVSMTFLLTNDYVIKEFFNNWRSTILNEETMEVGYKVDYQHTIRIHQLKRPLNSTIRNVNTSNIIYSVELKDAFPTTIQSIDLSNDLDTFSELTVQISYTNWKAIQIQQQSASLKINRPIFNFGGKFNSLNNTIQGVTDKFSNTRNNVESLRSRFSSTRVNTGFLNL
tara:strand:+ start:182 stop:895 length:714 start_codon:yes stop_codon:yes gene_type:complete